MKTNDIYLISMCQPFNKNNIGIRLPNFATKNSPFKINISNESIQKIEENEEQLKVNELIPSKKRSQRVQSING